MSKNFLKDGNAAACREMFFSKELPEPELERYQGLLREHASNVSVINVRHHHCSLLSAKRATSSGTPVAASYTSHDAMDSWK